MTISSFNFNPDTNMITLSCSTGTPGVNLSRIHVINQDSFICKNDIPTINGHNFSSVGTSCTNEQFDTSFDAIDPSLDFLLVYIISVDSVTEEEAVEAIIPWYNQKNIELSIYESLKSSVLGSCNKCEDLSLNIDELVMYNAFVYASNSADYSIAVDLWKTLHSIGSNNTICNCR